MPEEMTIKNLPTNMNLPGRLIQSFSLILLQVLALPHHVLSVGGQEEVTLRAASLLWS